MARTSVGAGPLPAAVPVPPLIVAPAMILVDGGAVCSSSGPAEPRPWVPLHHLDTVPRLMSCCRLVKDRRPDARVLALLHRDGFSRLRSEYQSVTDGAAEPATFQCVPFGCKVSAFLLECAKRRAADGSEVAVVSNDVDVVMDSQAPNTRWRHLGFMFIEDELILPGLSQPGSRARVSVSAALPAATGMPRTNATSASVAVEDAAPASAAHTARVIPPVRRTISKVRGAAQLRRGRSRAGSSALAPLKEEIDDRGVEDEGETLRDSQLDGAEMDEADGTLNDEFDDSTAFADTVVDGTLGAGDMAVDGSRVMHGAGGPSTEPDTLIDAAPPPGFRPPAMEARARGAETSLAAPASRSISGPLAPNTAPGRNRTASSASSGGASAAAASPAMSGGSSSHTTLVTPISTATAAASAAAAAVAAAAAAATAMAGSSRASRTPPRHRPKFGRRSGDNASNPSQCLWLPELDVHGPRTPQAPPSPSSVEPAGHALDDSRTQSFEMDLAPDGVVPDTGSHVAGSLAATQPAMMPLQTVAPEVAPPTDPRAKADALPVRTCTREASSSDSLDVIVAEEVVGDVHMEGAGGTPSSASSVWKEEAALSHNGEPDSDHMYGFIQRRMPETPPGTPPTTSCEVGVSEVVRHSQTHAEDATLVPPSAPDTPDGVPEGVPSPQQRSAASAPPASAHAPSSPAALPSARDLLGTWVRDGGRTHEVVQVPGPQGPYLEFRPADAGGVGLPIVMEGGTWVMNGFRLHDVSSHEVLRWEKASSGTVRTWWRPAGVRTLPADP